MGNAEYMGSQADESSTTMKMAVALSGSATVLALCTLIHCATAGWNGQCVKDTGNRVLPTRMPDSNNNNPNQCKNQCRSRGFEYAGVQWIKECFCGHDTNRLQTVGGHECNKRCPGGGGMCGGWWRMNVYGTGYRRGPCGTGVVTLDCQCGGAICKRGQKCISGQCVGPCGPWGSKPVTIACYCGTAKCQVGQTCQNGQCSGPPCGTGVVTTDCQCGDAKCKSGQRCVEGKCLGPCGTGVVTTDCQCGDATCKSGQRCVEGKCLAPAPPCGCGTVKAAQDGCQCRNTNCRTGQRCVQGQCKVIDCKHLVRVPMPRGQMTQCRAECAKTYCTGGCQSYELKYGHSDENKNGCFLSSCPYKPPKPKCQKLRIPMGPNKQQCLTKCKQTSGCKSYRIQYGYSDQMKNGCFLSSCPNEG